VIPSIASTAAHRAANRLLHQENEVLCGGGRLLGPASGLPELIYLCATPPAIYAASGRTESLCVEIFVLSKSIRYSV
jgi:hypothetical protein